MQSSGRRKRYVRIVKAPSSSKMRGEVTSFSSDQVVHRYSFSDDSSDPNSERVLGTSKWRQSSEERPQRDFLPESPQSPAPGSTASGKKPDTAPSAKIRRRLSESPKRSKKFPAAIVNRIIGNSDLERPTNQRVQCSDSSERSNSPYRSRTTKALNNDFEKRLQESYESTVFDLDQGFPTVNLASLQRIELLRLQKRLLVEAFDFKYLKPGYMRGTGAIREYGELKPCKAWNKRTCC